MLVASIQNSTPEFLRLCCSKETEESFSCGSTCFFTSSATLRKEQNQSMEWKKGAILGRGSFSTVNLAVVQHLDNTERFPALMAVKSSPLYHASVLKHEKSVLLDLQGCKQIIHYFGDDIKVDNESKETFYNLFLEYIAGGSLYDILCRSGGSLQEQMVQRCTRSILEGLCYVHSKGYAHCDIKLQNILVHDDNCFDIKIADFGLAKKIGEKTDNAPGISIRGTPLYMSPEAVSRNEFDCPADIWSLGCVVLEMLTGSPPWRCNTEEDAWSLLMRIGYGDELPEISHDLSSGAKDFVKQCLVKDPAKRHTAEMLLQHPFITDAENSIFSDNKCISLCQSPRTIFGFPEFSSPTSSNSYIFTSLNGTVHEDLHDFSFAAKGLQELAVEEGPQWSFCSSIDCCWIDVRVSEKRDCIHEDEIESSKILEEMLCRDGCRHESSTEYSDSSSATLAQLTLPSNFSDFIKLEFSYDVLKCCIETNSMLRQNFVFDSHSTCSIASHGCKSTSTLMKYHRDIW